MLQHQFPDDGFSGPSLAAFLPALIIPLIVFGIIVTVIVVAVTKHAKQVSLPHTTATAKVIGKRTYVSGGKGSYTTYFATFELDTGERIELKVSSRAYGLIMEQDRGQLVMQGKRLIDFTVSQSGTAARNAPPAPQQPPAQAATTRFVCKHCGSTVPREAPRCQSCGSTKRKQV